MLSPMETILPHRLAALWADLPPAAVLLIALLAATGLAVLSSPWRGRRRERRRIRRLPPPPPPRIVKEPELKLPRRSTADRTPTADD